MSPSLPGVSWVPSDPLAGSTRNPSGHQAGSAKASASVSGCNHSTVMQVSTAAFPSVMFGFILR